MKSNTFTRKELYNLVWSKPMSTLAREYSISDNGLRKICIRMNIPLPKLGHWQKLQYGKKVTVIKLPKNYDGEDVITLADRPKGSKNNTSEQTPFTKLRKEIEADNSLTLSVPDKLSKQDELIRQAKISLHKNKPNSYGNQNGSISTGRDEINISVSPLNVRRALRFMNTLINLLKQRNHNVIISDDGLTYAVINDEKIKISLREKCKQVIIDDGSWKRRELIPNGILAFKYGVYGDSEIKDGKTQRIEDRLSFLLAKFELEAKRIKERRIESEIWQKNYEEEQRIKKELQKKKDNELEEFKNLFKYSTLLHKANTIREYVNAVQEKSIQKNKLTEEVKEWIQWANKKADWYDPLVDSEDDLLNDVDKESLKFKNRHLYW